MAKNFQRCDRDRGWKNELALLKMLGVIARSNQSILDVRILD